MANGGNFSFFSVMTSLLLGTFEHDEGVYGNDDLEKGEEEADEAEAYVHSQHICRVQGEVGVEEARKECEDDEELESACVLVSVGAPAKVQAHDLAKEEDRDGCHLQAPNMRRE